VLRLALLVVLLALVSPTVAWPRAWSYHYRPETATPSPTPTSPGEATPAAAPQVSTARLLRQTIVSDLAARVREVSAGGQAASYAESRRIISLLAAFDKMGSADDLRVLTQLSDYYLGQDAEAVYDCVLLRKGATLTPYIRQAIDHPSMDCVRELGPSFEKPSQALGGHALCVTSLERNSHLNLLATEIDSAKSCADRQLAVLVRETRPFPSSEP
jgi:hypothetical protein